MRKAFIIAIGLMISTVATTARQADDVPDLNVEQVCRGIAGHALTPGEPDLSFDQCVKGEQNVRKHLKRLWVTFAAADKSVCVSEATTSGESSYTDLLTCLEIARELRNFHSSAPLPRIQR